jgi:hypothetical protein
LKPLRNLKECRGRSPLPGFGVSPIFPFILPPQAAKAQYKHT